MQFFCAVRQRLCSSLPLLISVLIFCIFVSKREKGIYLLDNKGKNTDTIPIQFRYKFLPLQHLYHTADLFIVLYQGANLTCITFVSLAITCLSVCYADFNTKIQWYKLFVNYYHLSFFATLSTLDGFAVPLCCLRAFSTLNVIRCFGFFLCKGRARGHSTRTRQVYTKNLHAIRVVFTAIGFCINPCCFRSLWPCPDTCT